MESEKKSKGKTGKIIATGGAVLILGVMVAANIVANMFSGIIDNALTGKGNMSFDNEDFQQAAAQSSELVKLIGEEGVALLKNDYDTLPLKYGENEEKNINVFGWASTDNGFLLRGIGSGSSTIREEKTVTLLGALKEAGFNVNQDLINMYESYYKQNFNFGTGNNSRMKVIEPPMSNYSASLLNDALDFSDTAIVTIARVAGENVGEIPQNQPKVGAGTSTDNSRHFLELSTEEEALIQYVSENYLNTIVIINSSNQMELGFLEKYDIGACLNVGLMGQNAAEAIPEILLGEVNPSGRLTDIYPYDLTTDPSYVNYIRNGNHIQLVEDIYFGYRYYETADAEGLFDDVSNDFGSGYDAMVQYPFGHGLSYSTFDWKLENVNVPNNSVITKEDKIELNFSCTNTGSVAGKDVMQVYVSAPYYGEIEKPAIQLVNYEKTVTLEPGKTQRDIIIEVDPYYFASYDCYDKNGNGYTTFELDTGDYEIKFMENSHTAKAMAEGQSDHLIYKINDEQIYDKDPVTGNEVTNRMTGDKAYAGVPLDGSTVFNTPTSYLTRDTLSGGARKMSTSVKSAVLSTANNYTNNSYNQTLMPTLNADNHLYLKTRVGGAKAALNELRVINNPNTEWDDDLVEAIATDYDSEELSNLIDQVSAEDACNLVENGGFGTVALESIGKEITNEFDGPAGFNQNTIKATPSNSDQWTAFPNEVLIGQTWSKYIAKQMGLAVGNEGKATGLAGWYAPGVNLHRSAFNARNYEYYSEDPILSGYMAAAVVDGAKANGVFCYVKHFTLSEPGQNARDLNTWLTEQNYRELYMRPFELTVKVGKAVGMMSAFNSVGGVWAGANYAQNVEILRNEWGFRGTIITDWSDGGGNMNGPRGVRAGNDIWLNGNPGNHSSKLNRTNPTDVYCAKLAVKNVVYTVCSTRHYALNYDHSNDMINAEVGAATVTQGVNWWQPTLIGIDIAVGVGLITWMVLIWIPRKKKEA